jgi:hypothetical protein
MPTERIPLQRPRRGHVSSAQWQELWLGPRDQSVFTSREELKNAWERAREKMMASLSPGRRPAGWWEFEFDGHRPPYFEERSFLWCRDLLTPEERSTLEIEWKAEFAKAQAPDFTLNDGSGELLVGDCARAAHYAWADIPRELVKRWTAAARRRVRARGASPEKAQENALGVASSVEGKLEESGISK